MRFKKGIGKKKGYGSKIPVVDNTYRAHGSESRVKGVPMQDMSKIQRKTVSVGRGYGKKGK